MEGFQVIGKRPGSAGMVSSRELSSRGSARGHQQQPWYYDDLDDSGDDNDADPYADLGDSGEEDNKEPTFRRTTFGKSLPVRVNSARSSARSERPTRSAGIQRSVSMKAVPAPQEPKFSILSHDPVNKENQPRPSSAGAMRSSASAERLLQKGGAWLAASKGRVAAREKTKAAEILAAQSNVRATSYVKSATKRPSSAPMQRNHLKSSSVLRVGVNEAELVRRLKRTFAKNGEILSQAFCMMDTNKSGFLSRTQLQKALERAGLRLMPSEIDWIFSNVDAQTNAGTEGPQKKVSYVAMTRKFYSDEKASETETGRQSMHAAMFETNALVMAPDLSTGEVKPMGTLAAVGGMPGNVVALFAKLHAMVSLRYRYIWAECVLLDDHRSGKIDLPMMAEILKDNGVLKYMTRKECYELLKKQRESSSGHIDYAKFLQRALTGQKVEQQYMPSTEATNRASARSTKASTRRITSSVVGRAVIGTSDETRALYRRLQPALRLCWRDVRREMKSKEKSFGVLSVHVFRKILENYGADLSDREFFSLMKYHSSKSIGRKTPAEVSAGRVRDTFNEGGFKKVPSYKQEKSGGIHFDSFFRAVLASNN